MNLLDIGVLAERSGVPASTLRYYEEVGLIASVARRGLRRQFDLGTLDQLAVIALGKKAGFSLDEIRGMFGKEGAPELSRTALHGRVDQLEDQIRELTTLRNVLRHVAECSAESHMACPKFQRLLKEVTKAPRQARRPR